MNDIWGRFRIHGVRGGDTSACVLDLHERLTALETARATAPVSDDEIVEELAKTSFYAGLPLRVRALYPWPIEERAETWRINANEQLRLLRAAGYDVVKRS